MSIGFWQILLVIVLVVMLFGRNKISGLMGDVAKGIKSFKKGLADDDDDVGDNAITRESEASAKDRPGDKESANG